MRRGGIEEREQDVQPEMQANTDLEENADRRQEDGKQNAKNVHDGSDFHLRLQINALR